MQTLILYGSQKKLTNAHKLVTVPRNGQPRYYVRAKLTHMDMLDALMHAKPKRGETVLNTIPIS
jgi:hypothetical protein